MVWGGEISSRGIRSLVILRRLITDDHYGSILADPFHPTLQILFPGECPVFQDNNTPVRTFRCVQTWLHEHDDEVKHLTWCPQSPNMNIISLGFFIENKVRARFPTPRTFSELETTVNEEGV
ncbi:transposable element Tcb2 transposase [Trichonephila clavipes]|nr:transposable element Tcb2 transposase [Trichonephila clavipes]